MNSEDLVYDYGVEKQEDVREGLIMEQTLRLTPENYAEYGTILPADARRDLPRPFFGGLISKGESASSWMVYENKNLVVIEDAVSRIRWMELEEADSGKRLLAEYLHETENIPLSVIEKPQASDTDRAVLSESGFSLEDRESEDIVATVGELGQLFFAQKKTPPYILSLKKTDEYSYKRGIVNCLIFDRVGLLEDLPYLPKNWFDEDVSSCTMTDQKINGFLLVHALPSNQLMVDLLFASGGDNRKHLLLMIRRSIRAAVKKYPPETPVILRRHNEGTYALVKKLFPEKKGETVLYGERREERDDA